MKNLITPLFIFIFSFGLMVATVNCAGPKDENDMGIVERLPKGNYTIWNYGSRHMVKCLREDGKYYLLNDWHFKQNGIEGYDAHQYVYKTQITIE